jgi:hypothetical protein
VTKIGALGTTQAATSNRRTLRRNTKSVLARATQRNNPEDTILHSHRRENLKSYMVKNSFTSVFSQIFKQIVITSVNANKKIEGNFSLRIR